MTTWFDCSVPEPEYAAIRKAYESAPLHEQDLQPEPMSQFNEWFAQAVEAGLPEPNAMTLATVDEANRPCARTVLLKGVDTRGFAFATNYHSRKGTQIAGNSAVALVFLWLPLARQVCVRGTAVPAPREQSQAYFASRPREHQLGAWSSAQSQPIADRQTLQDAYARAAQEFPDTVPTPEHWGIFIVEPESIEFWQGQSSRLHDRLEYVRTAPGGIDDPGAWSLRRLSP